MSDWPGTVPHMGRKALFDRAGMAHLLARQSGVITRSQARECAMSDAALRHRLRPGGPWQVLLPGVYHSTTTGSPARPQRLMAAQLYGGDGDVCHHWPGSADPAQPQGAADGFCGRADSAVRRRRRNAGFVRVHRTARMPNVVLWVGEVGYVPLARAVADTARSLRDVSEVRAVVADGVQRRRLHVSQLADELAQGPVQGSAGFRQVLGGSRRRCQVGRRRRSAHADKARADTRPDV